MKFSQLINLVKLEVSFLAAFGLFQRLQRHIWLVTTVLSLLEVLRETTGPNMENRLELSSVMVIYEDHEQLYSDYEVKVCSLWIRCQPSRLFMGEDNRKMFLGGNKDVRLIVKCGPAESREVFLNLSWGCSSRLPVKAVLLILFSFSEG